MQEIGLARLKRITFVGEMPPKYMMFALWLMCGALVLPFFAEPLCVEPGDYRAEIAETARGDTIVAHIRAQQQLKCGATLVPNKLRYSQYYMIFVIVSFFSFIMLMLHDVGDTSEGFWRLEFKEFSDLLPELSELEARERQVLEEAPTMKTATFAFTPIWCPVA